MESYLTAEISASAVQANLSLLRKSLAKLHKGDFKASAAHLEELLEQGIADEVIPEPLGGAHRDPEVAAESVRKALSKNLSKLRRLKTNTLLDKRYEKYRNIGDFIDPAAAIE